MRTKCQRKSFKFSNSHQYHNTFNPIQDAGGGGGGGGGGGWGGKKVPYTSLFPVTSTNGGISPQNSLTFSFNTFATLV